MYKNDTIFSMDLHSNMRRQAMSWQGLAVLAHLRMLIHNNRASKPGLATSRRITSLPGGPPK